MLEPGEVVGPYELTRRLGGGGFGEVWLARHLDLGVERALKIPTHPDAVRNLRKEGQIQCRLRHRNIVETIELNTRHDPPYFVMEYVKGRDLRSVLDKRVFLPPLHALTVVWQVLRALKAAHEGGVVHRDLKPRNVLVMQDWRVKVTDFGLGKMDWDPSVSLSLSGELASLEGTEVAGTLDYMSPEQRSGAEADPRDDLYALGVLGCELLAGSRPTPIGVAKMFRRAGLRKELAAVFERALDDREHRYQSAAEMEDDIRPLYLGERDGTAAGDAGPPALPGQAGHAQPPPRPAEEHEPRVPDVVDSPGIVDVRERVENLLKPLDRWQTAERACMVFFAIVWLGVWALCWWGFGWAWWVGLIISLVVGAGAMGGWLMVVVDPGAKKRGREAGQEFERQFPRGSPDRSAAIAVLWQTLADLESEVQSESQGYFPKE